VRSRCLCLLSLVLGLTACASSREEKKPPPPTHYVLDVKAPDEVRTLLLQHLDLAHMQHAPEEDGLVDADVDRLVAGAVPQARTLLETEGWFSPEVHAQRIDTPPGPPRIELRVTPGVRTTVRDWQLDVTGPLRDAADRGDVAAAALLSELRTGWTMKSGQPFRAGDWNSAKRRTLSSLRARGYAGANWQASHARVEVEENAARLALVADSGPLYHVGTLRIEGLERYPPRDVERLAGFKTGDAYSETLLKDYQERLQKSDLFENARVDLDADPATHEAAPVHVWVKEQPLHTAVIGLGYSANVGPRITLEDAHRRFLGARMILTNKINTGPDLQSWEIELSSHPLPSLWSNVLQTGYERLRSADEWRTTWPLRFGRRQDTGRIEHIYYGELLRSKVDTDADITSNESAGAHYRWTGRFVDSVQLPTTGYALTLQGGGGVAQGVQIAADGSNADRGPFVRLFSRLNWYRPLTFDENAANRWYLSTRAEVGEMFAGDRVGIPDPLLFRAGGDESVRGYEYRTLGPIVNGVVTSGRVMATGSIEIARPISPRQPNFWAAVFLDAGQAAQDWRDLDPVYGYGIGVRYRSPAGAMRVDLAYGEAVHAWRLHVSLGVIF
jgi:translocation and assembly module TamA